jgi:AsmA protein
VTSKKITYLDYYLENLNADLKIKGKDVVLNKIEADIYEGKLKAKGHLYPNQKLDFQGQLSRINLVKIEALKDSPIKKGRLEATTNLNLNLKEPSKALETLEGTLHFNITEGGIETLDIEALTTQFKKINDLSSLAKGIELTKKRNVLNIHTLTADLQIHKGQAKTDNAKILADPVDILGQGVIDLVKKLVNLKLNVKIKALGNLTIPFMVTGPWANPDYGINQEQLGALVTKNFGEQVVGKIMDQVQQQTKKAVDQGASGEDSSQNLNPAQVAKNIIGGLLR